MRATGGPTCHAPTQLLPGCPPPASAACDGGQRCQLPARGRCPRPCHGAPLGGRDQCPLSPSPGAAAVGMAVAPPGGPAVARQGDFSGWKGCGGVLLKHLGLVPAPLRPPNRPVTSNHNPSFAHPSPPEPPPHTHSKLKLRPQLRRGFPSPCSATPELARRSSPARYAAAAARSTGRRSPRGCTPPSPPKVSELRPWAPPKVSQLRPPTEATLQASSSRLLPRGRRRRRWLSELRPRTGARLHASSFPLLARSRRRRS